MITPKRLFFILFAALMLCSAPALAPAQEAVGHPLGGGGGFKPDDRVTFDISAEDWVTTKTAHAAVTVEAAVNASTAGTMRTEMTKAVDSLAKTDWRLTSFDRSQDQTGMERWSAVFEARLPETDLGALGDAVKKLSKPGMQLSVANIDFTPTLEEMETARGNLRAQIYRIANDQLASLNTALPGRVYRIALIDFTGDEGGSPMPRVVKGRSGMAMAMMTAPAPESSEPPPAPVERSEKIMLSARVVFAAQPGGNFMPPAPPPEKH